MSHRKFEAPRHGHMGFRPRKRAVAHRGHIRSFPKDDAKNEPHLTAFSGYKAGMTHVVRDMDRPGSKLHKKEVAEAVTVIEVPPIRVVGLVGYVETPRGLRSLTTVWAANLNDEARRRYYKRWYASKKKAFTKYAAKVKEDPSVMEKSVELAKKYCQVIRAICHTQVSMIKSLRVKKAHIFEVQVNGGDVEKKIEFVRNLFEQEVKFEDVFKKDEMIDVIGVTKGRGWEGPVTRWGISRLPRKTHRGLRKVACVGSWHPARLSDTVPRGGQLGYHHRTEINKKIYKIGKSLKEDPGSCSTEIDQTEKGINPLGGFVRYGMLRNDFVLLKGSCIGPKKRCLMLRKTLVAQVSRRATEEVTLKFIDTASKFGHGRFQTAEEKRKFFGIKKDAAAAEAAA
mmetsp:Transcript_3026/g.7211  ORF Transcript_3026/g.7211 Transcript_3026/m.7211 type:complete len:397 (+) Transcript_3026:50-1240(+)